MNMSIVTPAGQPTQPGQHAGRAAAPKPAAARRPFRRPRSPAPPASQPWCG